MKVNKYVPFMLGWVVVMVIIDLSLIYKIRAIRNQKEELASELAEVKKEYVVKSDALAACTRAVVGVGSGMIPLYESVDEEVKSIEMIIHSDSTESGEPRRFVLSCGDEGR